MGLRITAMHLSNHSEKSANNTSIYCNCGFMFKYSETPVDLEKFFTMCLLVATSTRFLQNFVVFSCKKKQKMESDMAQGSFPLLLPCAFPLNSCFSGLKVRLLNQIFHEKCSLGRIHPNAQNNLLVFIFD